VPESNLVRRISAKGSDKKKIAASVIKRPGVLPELFEGLKADRACIKYGCAKVLQAISERKPELLYPRFDFFVGLLDSDNQFFRWYAVRILANLASVDRKCKIEKIFRKYVSPIPGPALITAALAKPKMTERIAREILKAEKGKYKTSECRNVVLGHAVKSFDRFFDRIERKGPVVRFVRRQLENRRNATRKHAEKFLRKHGLETHT
jgi:hypothetical protein